MSNRDILSRFFKKNSQYKKKNKFSSSITKKITYLNKYNIFDTENNILKFTPKSIANRNRNIINIEPYSLYELQHTFTGKDLNKEISTNLTKKNFSLNNNSKYKSNILHNIQNNINNNLNKLNNKDFQNKTTSTYFNLRNNKIKKIIPKTKAKLRNILSSHIKNKSKTYNKIIDEEANKIVNFYMSTDLSNYKKNKEIKKVDNLETIKNNIKNKYLMEQKLLKMQNIKHKIMIGDFSNFRSINLQIKALGTLNNRKSLLKGIEDYNTNQTYRPLNCYALDIKGKNDFIEKSKITNEFEFEDNKDYLAFTERIKKKKHLKSRINNKLFNNYLSFNKPQSQEKKLEFMNFYEKINFLHNKVKLTNKHIQKRVEIRQKYKDNINSLLIPIY